MKTPATEAELHRRIFDAESECDVWRSRCQSLREAVMWCGGSKDFAEGGSARKGWVDYILPLLDATRGLP